MALNYTPLPLNYTPLPKAKTPAKKVVNYTPAPNYTPVPLNYTPLPNDMKKSSTKKKSSSSNKSSNKKSTPVQTKTTPTLSIPSPVKNVYAQEANMTPLSANTPSGIAAPMDSRASAPTQSGNGGFLYNVASAVFDPIFGGQNNQGAGRFLGLPEYGVSEGNPSSLANAAARYITGSSPEVMGGDQNTQNLSTMNYSPFTGGQVLGDQTQFDPNQPASAGSTVPTGGTVGGQGVYNTGNSVDSSAYDYQTQQLQDQLSTADSDKELNLSQLGDQKDALLSSTDSSINTAKTNADTSSQDALSAAQSAQRTNRNILRALGILGSSAGGELLARPMNDYSKQKGQIAQQLNQKLTELENYRTQKMGEYSTSVKQVMGNYKNVVANIKRDLRFTAEEKQKAIAAANAAFRQVVSQIQQQATTENDNVDSTISSLSSGLNYTPIPQDMLSNYVNG